jgi:uncharacterized membrane protein YjjB (DUF3815 family)
VSGTTWGFVANDAWWSGVASVGFAILFNVPRRMLPACFLIGAMSHGLRAALLHAGIFGVEAGTLLAATLIGFGAHGFARVFKAPLTTFAVAGAIPMVPGAFAFKAMLGVLRLAGGESAPALLVDTCVAGGKAGLILIAIAVGVGFPHLVLRRSDTADLEPRPGR